MPDANDDRVMERYILGDLPADERRSIERRLFEDDQTFDRLADVENDLIDAMARGELAADDAAKLREMLRVSSQEARVDFAGALAHAESPAVLAARLREQARVSRFARWRGNANRMFTGQMILVGPCAALFVFGSWMAVENQGLKHRLNEVAQQAAAQAETATGAVFAFQVPPGVFRSAERAHHYTIPDGTSIVRVDLALDRLWSGGGFSVTISTGGHAVWAQTGSLPAGEKKVSALVPRTALSPGRYEAALSRSQDGSQEALGYYYFVIN